MNRVADALPIFDWTCAPVRYSTNVTTPKLAGCQAGEMPPPQFMWAAGPWPSLSFSWMAKPNFAPKAGEKPSSLQGMRSW